MENKQPAGVLTIISVAVILAVLVIVSGAIGRFHIPITDLPQMLLERLARLVGKPAGSFWDTEAAGASQMWAILFNVRLPRIVLACLIGAALSAAGAAYQGVFQNPMAAPDILGASGGAAMGAALALLLQLPGYMVMVAAFVCSIAVISLAMLISKYAQGNRVLGLIMAGIMVTSLCNAVTSLTKLLADPNSILPEITYWLMGSLAKTKPDSLTFVLLPMAIGLVPLFLVRWRINLLTLSDDEAKTMGVNVTRIRTTVIICATLVTAASVSVSGLIGWVGLVIPHLTRRLVGNNYRLLMPASMLTGALFLLLVDNVSRNLMQTEIPIGILTSFIGAPFFLWLITRRKQTI
jgi:iron complex transport system permease protein